MTIETYKYFIPESSNLRADYGGASIITGGDSAETDAITLTSRHICRELDLPANATHYLFQAGTAGGNNWLRVSDSLYPAISAHLTASELSSVVSIAPSGFSTSSAIPAFQPKSRKKTLIVIGDSLSAGVSAANALQDAVGKQALDLIQATTPSTGEPAERSWENDTWALCNTALGSSSWGNTNSGGGIAAYPQRFDLAFNQRYRTMALNGDTDIYIHIWLGTNDIAYDSSLTGAQAWGRAATAIGMIKIEFPAVPIILGTCIRRSESLTLNGRLQDYNDEMIANYQTAGADHLVRYDQSNPVFDLTTGDSANPTHYAGDGVHLTTAGYGACANVLRDVLVGL